MLTTAIRLDQVSQPVNDYLNTGFERFTLDLNVIPRLEKHPEVVF